jgi:hypothetical protein
MDQGMNIPVRHQVEMVVTERFGTVVINPTVGGATSKDKTPVVGPDNESASTPYHQV